MVSKKAYLQQNRLDLRHSEFAFPQTDFRIVGFGAYHGSAKTYDAEWILLQSLRKQRVLDYYIVEANFSEAFFFQKYLETGDEILLRKLVLDFGSIVSQESTQETYEHWKRLKQLSLSDENQPIKIIGFDIINDFRFPIEHILYLTEENPDWKQRNVLERIVRDENTYFGVENNKIKAVLREFINDYELHKQENIKFLKDI